MPISGQDGVLLYDGDIYSIAQPASRRLRISDVSNIKALNMLTILNARTNLYSTSAEYFDKEQIRVANERRITNHSIGEIAELVREMEQGKFFRVVDERPKEGGFMMHIRQDHPKPPFWPSFLKFRSGASAFSNGSGAGLVRRATVPPAGRGFRKVQV